MDGWVGTNGFRQVLRSLGPMVPSPGTVGGAAFEIESAQALAALDRMSVPGVPAPIAARIREAASGRERLRLRLERTGFLRVEACGADPVAAAQPQASEAA